MRRKSPSVISRLLRKARLGTGDVDCLVFDFGFIGKDVHSDDSIKLSVKRVSTLRMWKCRKQGVELVV